MLIVNHAEYSAIFNSKAVGEPPLMYGIGAYFAIREAIKAFNSENSPAFDAPSAPERILMDLYGKKAGKAGKQKVPSP
jgi:xanthine dehydrogenase large subunit